MKRFGPFTAEGGLVLALIAVIAGGTFVVDSIAPDTKPVTRTVYGTPTVRVHQVGTGGIQPGAVQPRAVVPVVAASSAVPGTGVVTAAPQATVAPTKKKKKKAPTPTTPVTAAPAVTADPDPVEEPGPGSGEPTPCLLGPLCPPVASNGSGQQTTGGDAPKADGAKTASKSGTTASEPAASTAKAPPPAAPGAKATPAPKKP